MLPPPATDADSRQVGSCHSMTNLLLCRSMILPALKVSAVVGSVLNLVNNGQALLDHQSVNLWQILLNYVVPFFVSSYSAARNELARRGMR